MATAIIASISEPQRFKNGKQFAAYLGLVPRQHSTGGKPKLLGKSLADNRYLRMLLVHGARSIIYHHRAKPDARSRWLQKLVERRGFHKANVAPLEQKRAGSLETADHTRRGVYAANRRLSRDDLFHLPGCNY